MIELIEAGVLLGILGWIVHLLRTVPPDNSRK